MNAPCNTKMHARGFTLIEVLVAVTILAMIFSIVFGTFFYTVENAEEQEERAALYQRANLILNNVSRSVSSACIPLASVYGADNDLSVFTGVSGLQEDPTAVEVSMFTTDPRFASGIGGMAHVSFSVTDESKEEIPDWLRDENNPFVLRCTVEPLLAPEASEAGEPYWELNVSSFNVEFYDGSEWLQEWDYDGAEALPDAVRIDLALGNTEGGSYSFSTVARVHVNAVLETPREPEVQKIGEEEEEETETQEETEVTDEEELDEAAPEEPDATPVS